MKKNNPKLLDKFLKYLYVSKGYSKNTITSYNSDLLIFFNFIRYYLDIDMEVKNYNIFIFMKIKRSDIIAFLTYLNFTKDNNPYTSQRRLAAIRSFYKWLMISVYGKNIKENPTDNIGNIKKVERLPKYLSLEQSKEIQEIFSMHNSKYYIRNNAIISLFLSTGIRASELIRINIKDIDFDNKRIYIIGKGNRERVVYFSELCKTKLKKYLEYRKRTECKDLTSNDALFINKRGKRIGIDGVENVCKKAYKLMGLEDRHYTAHTLRHTAATIMYKYVKPDIKLVKEFLGHSSIASTEIYTHIYNKDVENAVTKNPLNKYY